MENPIYGDLFKVFIMIIGILISCLASIIAFYLKDLSRTIKERLKAHDEEIGGLKGSMIDLREMLPREYVLKEDYIRGTAGLAKRIEDLCRKIDKYFSLKGGPDESERSP